MSIGFDPKNQLPAKQALKVETLFIRGSDFNMYTSTAGTPTVITGNTMANPTVVTTATPHGLQSGQTIVISGSNSTPSINGAQVVTVISSTTFSVPVNVTVAGTTGSFATSNITILIGEPVNAVYTASVKVDASNSAYDFNQASISIVDSNGGLSGFNFNTAKSVSDQSSVLLTGYPASLAANDVISMRYKTQENLNTPTPTEE
jgi:hypothetical protein